MIKWTYVTNQTICITGDKLFPHWNERIAQSVKINPKPAPATCKPKRRCC